ncbi:uncharacterized protein LOC117315903 [Pecten maximus]|uniref:uncharacterized protein LOC117315903 n=1 Tax=Pecten maximus TaxID=6579 RepID=UPI001458A432|nr:uncharacterized protein LOC117315903 [Pecten maximus]
MRFNDTFPCKRKGTANQWIYSGWGRWGRWNILNEEPEGCPVQECVIIYNNEMFTWWCYVLLQALCETGVFHASIQTTDSDQTTTSSEEDEDFVDWSTVATMTSSEKDGDFVDWATVATMTSSEKDGDFVDWSTVATMTPTTSTSSAISATKSLVDSDVENGICAKCCSNKKHPSLDQDELDDMLLVLRVQLVVNKAKLSANRRKLISVYDTRPSSVAMGCMAGAILVTVVGIIVIPDAISLCRFVFKLFKSRRKTSVV